MLDNIIKFSIKNKLVIGIFTLGLIGWGIWSATKLPIDALPDITNNQVQIITVCPTLATQEVEQLVTFPLEQSIANIPGLDETRSISRFGLSVVTAIFKEDVDIYFARQLINEKLKEAVDQIPEGIGRPELGPVSTGLGEVYQYILHPKEGSEDKYSPIELREMQDWIVARQLYGTPGIAEVNSFGGKLKQYVVALNPDKLKAMGVSITDIFDALENNNQNTGGGYIEKQPNAYFIRGVGIVSSIEDIERIAVKTDGKVPIFIKDVADVRIGSAIRYGALTYNGEKEAVGGIVMMLKGENSKEVVQRIKAKIPTIQKSLPDDVVIEPYLDRSDLVSRAIHTVEKNLLEGALIVIFVLIIFLGNFRAGLIVASAIPLSLLFALGMMNVFGVSANLMSLGAIDFGLIVDGAVIIVEAVMHHLGLRKSTARLTQVEMDEEVFHSASKIRNSAAFGEIIILIVYLPILFLGGIEGKMFRPMALTVCFAIFGALILSLTYIPMMSAAFLPRKVSGKATFSEKMMKRFNALYHPILEKAIKVKYWVIAFTIILFATALYSFRNLGAEFIPQLQEGDFAFHCILPQGSSLTQSIETSLHASRIIKKFDEVEIVVGKTGAAEVPTDPMPPAATDLIIVLKPRSEWKVEKSYEELAQEMLKALEAIPGVYFEASQPIQMRFNELMTGVRQDVAVKIFGENLDTLAVYAEEVSDVIETVAGTSNPKVERVKGLPQINVHYDRTRLANYGISVHTVNDVLSTAFAGKVAGKVYENERRFDLVVRLDSAFRTGIDDVQHLMIPTHSGTQIPLSQVADISYEPGPAQISRENGKRRIVIGFNTIDRDVKSVVEDIRREISENVDLPTGYYFTFGGQFENLQEATDRLLIAVPLSLFLIFILLFFTFNSIKEALLIFTAIPMSAIGGVYALWLRDMPFSISAGVGFIALFGVSVLNGIVLIGTFNQLKKDGVKDILQRVFQGTEERLRPVLMTATVASLGFLPMAISTSAGAEVQRPLATVVIGGLTTATFLTLIVLPLLYIIFETKIKFKMKSKTMTLLLCFISLSLTANAQSPHRLQLHSPEEAIEIALAGNANLKAAEMEIKSAASLEKTAYALPKMDFNLQLGKYSSYEFDNAIEISQTIPFPTVFKARKEVFTSEVAHKKTERSLSVVELKNQVRSVYYSIRYLQEKRKQLLRLDSLYEDFVAMAELRYKAGDTGKTDVNSAQVKRGEVHIKLKENELELFNAYSKLQILLNADQVPEIINTEEYKPLTFIEIPDSVQDHPAIALVLQDAKLAAKQEKLEKALALPDISIAYTNQSLIGYQTIDGREVFFDGNDRFSFFNIGLSIPLFTGTQAKVKSLRYEQKAAQYQAVQQRNILNRRLAIAIQTYRRHLQQFHYYRDSALPSAREIVSAARLGYRTGADSYVEYLYAVETASDIRLNYLKSIRKVNQSVINIYSLSNIK